MQRELWCKQNDHVNRTTLQTEHSEQDDIVNRMMKAEQQREQSEGVNRKQTERCKQNGMNKVTFKENSGINRTIV